MTSQWYYGRGSEITGPVTDRELYNLATNGGIIPSDTIWREGVENGVPASSVKNLFLVIESPINTTPPKDDSTPANEAAVVPTELAPPPPVIPVQAPQRSGRASPGKGAILLSQDGKTVKYKGKCSVCGREDTSYKSIPIPRGTTRVGFFCSKCRKRREVEIHGFM